MDTQTSKRVPVVEGWFTLESEEPRLIGVKCKSCGDYFFPRAIQCRNPNCRGEDLEETLLGRKGKIWSFTINHYQPPAPYVPPDPFVPYGLAVVELPESMHPDLDAVFYVVPDI